MAIQWNEEALALSDLCIDLRRKLHRHPELSSKEEATVALIDQFLKDQGIRTQVVEHGGVLGWIEGGKPGRTVLLRADIDALPIEEEAANGGGLPKSCVSEVKGVQHACGHDGHTAMLLTAAKLLQAHREDLEGTVLLCFERGEEATMNIYHIMKALEKAGIHPDSVFGLHVSPHTPAGTLQIQAGPLMAGMFSFHVRLQGRGGHGSRPDLCINPIDCYAAIGQALAALRGGAQDAAHGGQEAEVGHVVGLVQDGDLDLVEADESLPHEIQEPAGTGDDDVDPRLEGLLLGFGGDPAEDGGHVHVDDAGQGLDDLGDLESELAGGGQDQADGVAGAGLVLLRQALDQRQAEGQGFARAGAAAAEHVAPGEGVGQGGGLDGEGRGEAAGVEVGGEV